MSVNPDSILSDPTASPARLKDVALHLRKAIKATPSAPDLHFKLGLALRGLERIPQAIKAYRKATSLGPTFVAAHYNLANALRESGRLQEAAASYRRAITLRPTYGKAHKGLTSARSFRKNDNDFKKLMSAASVISELEQDDRINLGFALAKAYEDVGDYRRAWHFLVEANREYRATLSYLVARDVAQMKNVRNTCSAAWLRRFAASEASRSELPVFIVGMPRSGTTLVEQLLGSHPKVHAAGELNYLPNLLSFASGQHGEILTFPEYVPKLAERHFTQLGNGYLRQLKQHAPRAQRIVDKMPMNFLFIGMIRVMFPRARVIYCKRNPMAVGLSLFQRLFENGHEYSYDLKEIGLYYRAHQQLLDHWRSTVQDDLLIVEYEGVVQDFEKQARRILDHCDLAWHPGCLEFFRSRRVVRTASAVQVRQPIFSSSLDKWRHYEAGLQPLNDTLSGE